MIQDELNSIGKTLHMMADMKLIRTAEIRKQYRCMVCGCWDEWTEHHGAFERIVGSGYAAYDIEFVVCSDKCRKPENLKEPFIAWLMKYPGFGKVKATKNYLQTIKLLKNEKAKS